MTFDREQHRGAAPLASGAFGSADPMNGTQPISAVASLRPSGGRRAVLVSHDASFLSRRLLSLADMVAWRCNWPLCIVESKVTGAPVTLRTPAGHKRVFDPGAMPAETLTRRRNDVIVLGVPQGWEGSQVEANALRVASKATCSVWLMRDALDERDASRAPRRILVGAADSERSARVVAFAASVARSFDAELTVAHVVDEGAFVPSDPSTVNDMKPSSAVACARERMAPGLARLVGQCRDAKITFPIGEAAETLIALSSGFDLVVVGRGSETSRNWEPGCVAARLASDGASALLIVR